MSLSHTRNGTTRMTTTGRFLMVELESNLHPNRVHAFMDRCVDFNGVVSVTDLAAITSDTLETILMKPEPVFAPQRISCEPEQAELF